MNKRVDAEALLRMARKYEEFDEGGWSMPVKAVPVEAIEAAPAVDAVPVVHGRWGEYIVVGYNGIKPIWARPCSECGYENLAFATNYCPRCGAKMNETGADNARRPHLSKV